MYPKEFQKSLSAVEKAREKNIALNPVRMTASEKEEVLIQFHPDNNKDAFVQLKVGKNKGGKVPLELGEVLEAPIIRTSVS